MNSPCPKRIYFHLPGHVGHRFAYFNRMLPAFFPLQDKFGLELVLGTTELALESEEFSQLLAPHGSRLRTHPLRARLPRRPAVNALANLQDIKRSIAQLHPDRIYVCFADGLWQMLEMTRRLTHQDPFSGIPAEGWIFRGGFTYQDSTSLKDRQWRRLFRSSVQRGLFETLHLDDEILHNFALQIPQNKTHIELARNPVLMAPQKTATLARAELQVAESTTIGTAGMIDTRKGCDLLIKAHHQMFRQGNQTQLLLAGPHSEEIRGLIHDRIQETPGYAQWILSYDRFLNEEEIFNCMSACDLVIAPYPRHSGRSSIILWAATCGRPSLATDRGCLAHVVKTERLGEVTSVEHPETLANSIKTMIGREWTPSDHKRWRSYAEFHSIENYQRSAVKHLSLRLPQ